MCTLQQRLRGRARVSSLRGQFEIKAAGRFMAVLSHDLDLRVAVFVGYRAFAEPERQTVSTLAVSIMTLVSRVVTVYVDVHVSWGQVWQPTSLDEESSRARTRLHIDSVVKVVPEGAGRGDGFLVGLDNAPL